MEDDPEFVPFAEGIAIVRHAETGEEYEINSDELEWNVVGTSERGMGVEIHYEAIVEHGDLGELKWALWEYPVEVENYSDTDVNGHVLERNFNFGMRHELPYDPSKVDELVRWFFETFEDPANSLPYITREGGYQWVEGGPYDAREALSEEFPNASDDVLDRAVSEIEAEGIYDWALRRDHWEDEEYSDGYEDFTGEGVAASNSLEDAEDGASVPVIPAQASGLQFRLNSSNRVELLTNPDEDQAFDGVGDLIPECVEAVEHLLRCLDGTNAYTNLRDKTVSYNAVLVADQISIASLFARGVRLQNARYQLSVDVEAGNLPEPPAQVLEAIQSVLDLHGPLLLASGEGRRLVEDARQYALSDSETKQYQQVVQGIATAVSNSRELFEEDAVNEIVEVSSEVGTGLIPSMSNALAVSTFSNLIKVISTPLVSLFKNPVVQGVAFMGFAETALGAGVGQGLASLMELGGQFLYSNLSLIKDFAPLVLGDTNWLSQLVKFLESLR